MPLLTMPLMRRGIVRLDALSGDVRARIRGGPADLFIKRIWEPGTIAAPRQSSPSTTTPITPSTFPPRLSDRCGASIRDNGGRGGLVEPAIEDAPPGGLILPMSAVYPTSAPPGPAGRWLIERLKLCPSKLPNAA
jgi:hypothetical protein